MCTERGTLCTHNAAETPTYGLATMQGSDHYGCIVRMYVPTQKLYNREVEYRVVWIGQTSGDTEIQCSLDKSDLRGH